jgi:AraC-like DNA-binding protein
MNIGDVTKIIPRVNFANRRSMARDYQWPLRYIPDYQLFYLVRGEAAVRLSNRWHVIHPGQCVYINPGQPYQYTIKKNSIHYSVHFEWNSESPHPVHPASKIKDIAETDMLPLDGSYDEVEVAGMDAVKIPYIFTITGLEPLFKQLTEEYAHKQILYELKLRATIIEILTMIIRHFCPRVEQKMQQSRLKPAYQAMVNQPEIHWNVRQLAKLCGYHPNYFTKMFVEEMGTTPKEYLIKERLKLAKQLLLQEKRFEDVALKLGYKSYSHFSSSFRLMTGLTPSEFILYGNETEPIK